MSWGSEGGADVVECLSVDFNELGLGRATKGGRKVVLAVRAQSWRIGAAHLYNTLPHTQTGNLGPARR